MVSDSRTQSGSWFHSRGAWELKTDTSSAFQLLPPLPLPLLLYLTKRRHRQTSSQNICTTTHNNHTKFTGKRRQLFITLSFLAHPTVTGIAPMEGGRAVDGDAPSVQTQEPARQCVEASQYNVWKLPSTTCGSFPVQCVEASQYNCVEASQYNVWKLPSTTCGSFPVQCVEASQ
ncbi:unnamed protein product [Pleuronectes platessa]|uniref:Uncharacterized protein n=1 Tax=Pleuronectes platessa TaxID=8262 RepID=A0A9N7YMM2_PLEPL|nr:unnamed protein product [Pleuronectes platessa]